MSKPKEVILDWDTYVDLSTKAAEVEKLYKELSELKKDPNRAFVFKLKTSGKTTELLEGYSITKEMWEEVDKTNLITYK